MISLINLTFDHVFKIIISICALIVALSIGYYFVIFIPHKEQVAVEKMQKEQDARIQEEKERETEKAKKEEDRKVQLESCLESAKHVFLEDNVQFCRSANSSAKLLYQNCISNLGPNEPLCQAMEGSGNRPDNCELGGTAGQEVKDRYAKAKNSCHSNFGT
jgi:hypothetical protein